MKKSTCFGPLEKTPFQNLGPNTILPLNKCHFRNKSEPRVLFHISLLYISIQALDKTSSSTTRLWYNSILQRAQAKQWLWMWFLEERHRRPPFQCWTLTLRCLFPWRTGRWRISPTSGGRWSSRRRGFVSTGFKNAMKILKMIFHLQRMMYFPFQISRISSRISLVNVRN